MAKIRVYELAKKLNLSSKDLINMLAELGVEVKNHMSTVSEREAKAVEEIVTEEQSPEEKTGFTGKKEDTVKKVKIRKQRTKAAGDRDVDLQKGKKKPKKQDDKKHPQPREKEKDDKVQRTAEIAEKITVKDLADILGVPATHIIKKLIPMGIMAAVNQNIDGEIAAAIGREYGFELVVKKKKTGMDYLAEEEDQAKMVPRSPVITVMGHVDHGKTSLLDRIRETKVTEQEAGGITQHIGAYKVKIGDREIVFLDTPGHEAFTAMRARGAQVTDIAILVVAADDGVMPQTIEAINHARAAGVPLVVAINKIDKPAANPGRVKQELADQGLMLEEWGGDTIGVEVSAHTGEGIDELLEMVLLVADMQELKANPDRNAVGTVIEAKLDKGRGPVATVLVQKGTLRVGDSIVVGATYGKVRAMTDDNGKRISKAGPSTPIEVIGLSEVPDAGDILVVTEDDKTARHIAQERKERIRTSILKSSQRVTLEDLFSQIKEGKVKDLNIIIKADVHGSVEAVKQSIEKLSSDEVRIKPIHSGVGAITETDVMLAAASNAIVIGFNVRPDSNAVQMANNENVDIRTYRIIYDAINDIEAAIKGMLEPKFKEVVIGKAEVRATFKVSSIGTIAGCYVQEGKIQRNGGIRVVRDGIVVFEGKIDSLKRFKDDVREVLQGYECGLTIEGFNDIKEGDELECFVSQEVPR
ncbi:MAG: translation initiation factor IF-2 [Clostridiales bacterium]|nr:translation initiation factor IF-2 [Clostridiales bacterium]